MSEIVVRPLGEDDWQDYRSVRLAALTESPEAFVATAEQEEAFEEEAWRERMRRSERLVAEREGMAVGVVSIGQASADDPSEDAATAGELFGLWVRPEARGSGIATRLVRVGAARARDHGRAHLVYWVGTDNGRAVAFASGMGFRPTDLRRPMGVVSEEDGDEEVAMVLPLADDGGPQDRL
ncbi:MAG: GNAT family N-acetyltransferase [Terracoccus sp.]